MPVGWSDPDLDPQSWYDDDLDLLGWFDHEEVDTGAVVQYFPTVKPFYIINQSIQRASTR